MHDLSSIPRIIHVQDRNINYYMKNNNTQYKNKYKTIYISLSESLRHKQRKRPHLFLFRITLAAIFSSCRNLFTLKIYTHLLYTLWERALRRRGCGINCECGGIVRNDIFPVTIPYKYPYFSSLSNRRLNVFTGSMLGA